MRIQRGKVHLLNIPFKFSVSHAMATRDHSDSIIVQLTDSHGNSGFGEAVVREYVSGSLGSGEELTGRVEREVKSILSGLNGEEIDIDLCGEYFRTVKVDLSSYPILCAVETAILDLLCQNSGRDIYDLLGLKPRREKLQYGGTLPMMPLEVARRILDGYGSYGISNIKVKIDRNLEYTRDVLSLGRELLGDNFDFRVDANASWDLEAALKNLEVLRALGVRLIEQPFERGSGKLEDLRANLFSKDFIFMADESAITISDIDDIAEKRDFSMVNIRLSKNGGFFKALEMARKCDEKDIKYQIGCHVGETGILSAEERVLASLLDPVYLDGSYDSYILEENVTTENIDFGIGGYAGIIRNRGIGFKVDENRLKRLSTVSSDFFEVSS